MSDDEIREFWIRSIFDQTGNANGYDDRRRRRWVMSTQTAELLWRLLAPQTGTFGPFATPPLTDTHMTLIGYPVDIDDSAQGAVLVDAPPKG